MASRKTQLSEQNAPRTDEPDAGVGLDLGPPPEPDAFNEPLPPDPMPADPEAPTDPTTPPPSDEGVVVASSAEMLRTAKYRVLKEKKMFWRGQQVHFRVGEEFDASTFPADTIAAFQETGLELEQIE